MTMSRNILRSAEKEIFWQIFERKQKKQIKSIWQLTRTVKERPISWHLATALKLDDKKNARISFNEITEKAVKDSLKQAREIDMDLVDAQQARRILDRVVGYRIGAGACGQK